MAGQMIVEKRQVQDARRTSAEQSDMISIAGGTFRIESDKHFPEEAPVHCVTVNGFWIDRTPINNNQA